MNVTEVEYGSYLSYTPYPNSSEIQQRSKTITIRLKNDALWPSSELTTSELIIRQMMKDLQELPFADFFTNKPVLVPIPRSSLMKSDSLWVPKRIAMAMVKEGLGSKTIECLKRVKAVTRASTSSSGNRPKAIEHYNSFGIETLSKPDEILLIDDVVTRGATIIGAANRLKDVFPDTMIRAFVIVRTVHSTKFSKLIDPCKDTIILQNGETYRKPDSFVIP